MPPYTHTSSAAHSFHLTPTPSTTTATATQTITSTPVLRLRATTSEQSPAPRRGIQWAENVVDNEGLGRKSSKGKSVTVEAHIFCGWRVCCIYHAPHAAGESSSGESSSSSDGDSSSDDPQGSDDDGAAKRAGSRKVKASKKGQGSGQNDHLKQEGRDNCEGHDHAPQAEKKGKSKSKTGNAYEQMPKLKGGSNTVVGTKP